MYKGKIITTYIKLCVSCTVKLYILPNVYGVGVHTINLLYDCIFAFDKHLCYELLYYCSIECLYFNNSYAPR